MIVAWLSPIAPESTQLSVLSSARPAQSRAVCESSNRSVRNFNWVIIAAQPSSASNSFVIRQSRHEVTPAMSTGEMRDWSKLNSTIRRGVEFWPTAGFASLETRWFAIVTAKSDVRARLTLAGCRDLANKSRAASTRVRPRSACEYPSAPTSTPLTTARSSVQISPIPAVAKACSKTRPTRFSSLMKTRLLARFAKTRAPSRSVEKLARMISANA